jgi:hypothetical protein
MDLDGIEHPHIHWTARQPRLQLIVRTAAFQPEPQMHINPVLDAHAG